MKLHPFNKFEDVHVSEWIDGDICSFSLKNGKIAVRTDDQSIVSEVLQRNPWLDNFLRRHPDAVVDGVAYGHRRLRYDTVRGQIKALMYDIHQQERWLNPMEARLIGYDLQWVPTIATGHFTVDWLRMNRGRTYVPGASDPRAGCVIRPQVNRNTENGESVILSLRNDSK